MIGWHHIENRGANGSLHHNLLTISWRAGVMADDGADHPIFEQYLNTPSRQYSLRFACMADH